MKLITSNQTKMATSQRNINWTQNCYTRCSEMKGGISGQNILTTIKAQSHA